jgi:hypothetical protein
MRKFLSCFGERSNLLDKDAPENGAMFLKLIIFAENYVA